MTRNDPIGNGIPFTLTYQHSVSDVIGVVLLLVVTEPVSQRLGIEGLHVQEKSQLQAWFTRELFEKGEQLRRFFCIKYSVLQHIGESAIEQIDNGIVQIGNMLLNPGLKEIRLLLIHSVVSCDTSDDANQCISGASFNTSFVEKRLF